MTENKLDFWTGLRFEITNSGILDAYCDWIEPKVYYFELNPSVVEGRIGFLTPEMEEFKFKLTIDKMIEDSSEIETIDMKHWTIEKKDSGFNGNTLEIKLIK
ncbi:hypothetical protein BTO06_12365 [Tenacibaculum sp. SZ-18]|uniref:hypothetical protein n=1 Tax=Tenacibaculum sp. SZ-18 TaxID=754423 RepID=UPI000C2D2863|nr:hypothetical protein [Tenacibaculum sp. SZ-18]AUC15896.1 hypothetical protein BTO06_12365 [Tenacibaculum sp. SZ-18]